MTMWIMVVDRPYHPYVKRHETYESALKSAEDWRVENKPIDPPGLYEAIVYVAEVSVNFICRCDY